MAKPRRATILRPTVQDVANATRAFFVRRDLRRTGSKTREHTWGFGAMRYRVKEIFYTLQGEGANTGRPAVFCRFSGCNLWSGREENRLTAICRFCDTDFVGVDGLG